MANNPDQGKSAAQLRTERERRLMDTIELKIPDRVPVMCGVGYFPAKYYGIPFSTAYYNFDAWYAACKKTLEDFQPDSIFPQTFTPGKALEILQPNNMKWPGYDLDENMGHQSIEIDGLMKADEIDTYMKDPSDYMLRTFMSRTCEISGGLADLPKLSDLGGGGMGIQMLAIALAEPSVAKTIRELQKVGREMRKWRFRQAKFNKMMLDLGYFQYIHGAAMPPYDVISNSMRGMRQTMFDMYRQPDKLIELCEFILEQTLTRPLPPPNEMGYTRLFMTVTRGADNFLSVKQWEKFYWPTFKKLVSELINKGATLCIFFEGDCDARMEYLLDLPKGKILARVENTDIFRAKEILKDHVCLEGNLPCSVLQTGTVDDVKACVKKLIDVVGKDGGYVISANSSLDYVKPENLQTMIEFAKEYGQYN